MTDFEVEVRLETELSLPAGRLRSQLIKAAVLTLREEGATAPAALTLLLTSAEQIRVMNRNFRQTDKPTDVLSFPAEQDVPGMEAYLGDVVIAVPVAQAQADAAGHGLLPELILLTVHGVLHLLGYDHLALEEQEAMWSVQDRILGQLGVELRSPAYDG
jgi:probable rRNA maturation factor